MDLTGTQKRRAGTAIEFTYRDYTREGGLRDLEALVKDANVGCSSYIYNLAVFASKQAHDLKQATEAFSTMCEYAEARLKEKHKVENLKDVLPVWPVYKSNIVRAMRAGLDPADYGSEGALRAAREEHDRTAGPKLVGGTATTDHQPDATAAAKSKTVGVEQVEQRVNRLSPVLEPLFAQLYLEAEYIRRGREQDAQKILEDAVTAMGELVDKRRVKDPAIREALSRAA